MGSTFSANTLTQTGTIGNDTIDPNDQYIGFGNLITNGPSAINSVSPFQTKSPGLPGADYTKIKGQDVKLVHGDRWQELEAFMTENVQKDFKTTIGSPPTFKADSSGELDYIDPTDNSAPPGSPSNNLEFDPAGAAGTDAAGNSVTGFAPTTTQEKADQPTDPGKGQAQYILNVRGDQKTAIGGDVSLWVAGYNDAVQIGQYKASYFSQYISNTGDSQYHNIPDSYVAMNNDYKLVYDTKYRNVDTKKDIARISLGAVMGAKLEYKSVQASAVLINGSVSLCSIGLRVIGNDTFGLHSLAMPAKAEVAGGKAKCSPSANASPSIQPCPFTG